MKKKFESVNLIRLVQDRKECRASCESGNEFLGSINREICHYQTMTVNLETILIHGVNYWRI